MISKILLGSLLFTLGLFVSSPALVSAGGPPQTSEEFYLLASPNRLSLSAGTNPISVMLSTAGTEGSKQLFQIKGVNGTLHTDGLNILYLWFDTLGSVSGVNVRAATDIINGDGQKYQVIYAPLALDNVLGWQLYTSYYQLPKVIGNLPQTLTNATINLAVWNVSGSAPSVVETNSTIFGPYVSGIILPYTP